MRRIRWGIIAALCALLLLAAPGAGSAQDLNEAGVLNTKVMELYSAGQYADAIPLAQRALSIREKALSPDHPDLASSLENLAALYSTQERYADAEGLYKRALAIRERIAGPENPSLTPSLNDLALIYYNQNRYSEAEVLHKRVLSITEKASGHDHPEIVASLTNLAIFYKNQRRFLEAATLYERALAIREKASVPIIRKSWNHYTIWRFCTRSGVVTRTPYRYSNGRWLSWKNARS